MKSPPYRGVKHAVTNCGPSVSAVSLHSVWREQQVDFRSHRLPVPRTSCLTECECMACNALIRPRRDARSMLERCDLICPDPKVL